MNINVTLDKRLSQPQNVSSYLIKRIVVESADQIDIALLHLNSIPIDCFVFKTTF